MRCCKHCSNENFTFITLDKDSEPHSQLAAPLHPISTCQQQSVVEVLKGAAWSVTPRPYRRPMENTRLHWERITGLRTTTRLSVSAKGRRRRRRKKIEHAVWKASNPKGQSHRASEELDEESKNRRCFTFLEGIGRRASYSDIRGNSHQLNMHLSDQSVYVCVCLCVSVCMKPLLHLRLEHQHLRRLLEKKLKGVE